MLEWLHKQLETNDNDVLCEIVRSFAEELMGAEAEMVCGPRIGRYLRTGSIAATDTGGGERSSKCLIDHDALQNVHCGARSVVLELEEVSKRRSCVGDATGCPVKQVRRDLGRASRDHVATEIAVRDGVAARPCVNHCG